MIVTRRKRNPKDKGKGRDSKDIQKPQSSTRIEIKKDGTSMVGRRMLMSYKEIMRALV